MPLSIFLAKFFGLYLIIAGLLYLVRKADIHRVAQEFYTQKPLVFVMGFIGVIIGLLVVLSHNVWTPDWRLIITLIGYLALLKGLFRLFFTPDKEKRWAIKMVEKNGPIYIGIVCLIIGLYLAYKGFYSPSLN